MQTDILGIPSHIEQYGRAGEEVLLLHGWGKPVTLKRHLEPLALALGEDYHVTALEFPAHGQTGKPAGVWGVPEFAAWVKAAMEQLDLRHVTVVAHSFGGRVALWLAAKEPQLIRRLVLTGAAGLSRDKTPEEEAEALRYKKLQDRLSKLKSVPLLGRGVESVQRTLRDRRSSQDYRDADEDVKPSFVKIVGLNLRPILPEVGQPALLVWGDQDDATPLWMGQAMEKEMKDAALVVFEGRGHFAYLEELRRFVNLVKAFIGEDMKQRG